jgi:hypothetical protein
VRIRKIVDFLHGICFDAERFYEMFDLPCAQMAVGIVFTENRENIPVNQRRKRKLTERIAIRES